LSINIITVFFQSVLLDMFRHFDADAWKFRVMTCVKR